MSVTIYHNPACSTSRNALALIRESGIEPRIVDYLKTPPDRATLEQLAQAVGGARALLREKAPPYAELGLADPKWSDAALIGCIVQHPILLQRPLVVGPKGTAMCRPADKVRELL